MGTVVVGDPVAERIAALRRGYARRRREQILDPDRNAAQGALIAGTNGVGFDERLFEAEGHKRVQPRVVTFDRRH